MASQKNYWFSTCPTRHTVSSGIVRNAEVLIIGGGIAGITLLYQLLQAGITDVYLVEESTVGFHASGRSSGQLMLRGLKLFHEMENGKEYLEFIGENNRKFLNGLRNVSFDTDLRESGGLRLASNEKELERLEKESDFIREHRDINCPILSKKEVDSILNGSSFAGGMFVPVESTFNPYKVVNGLRELIEKKGARVLTGCQVTNIEEDDKGLAVSIRHKGTIRAKQIVYCTNAYTPEIVPELAEIMTPYRGQMIATDLLQSEAGQIFPAMSMSSNDCSEYFRMHRGYLLVGGKRKAIRGQQKQIIDDGEVSPGVYDKLRSYITKSLPILSDVKFTHTWSGIMCETPDGLPLIGKLPNRDNQFILAGFNGYGYSQALQGSILLRNAITNNDPINKMFDPARFLG